MARKLAWGFIDHGGTRDWMGYMGPFKMFTLAQLGTPDKPELKWELTSHILPSKHNKKKFEDHEDGQSACQKIVEGFASWIADAGVAGPS